MTDDVRSRLIRGVGYHPDLGEIVDAILEDESVFELRDDKGQYFAQLHGREVAA